MKTAPKTLDKSGIIDMYVFMYSCSNKQLPTIFHLVCWGGKGRHHAKYHPLTHSAFIHQELLCGAQSSMLQKDIEGKKYISCLPFRIQLLKILDTKVSFLITIFRHVFKVSRATVLGKSYLRPSQAFPCPQSTLNWGLKFGYLILLLKKSR